MEDKRNKITEEQAEEAVRLYESGKYSITEILSMTDIRSSQTVYRILMDRQITKRTAGTKVSVREVPVQVERSLYEDLFRY